MKGFTLWKENGIMHKKHMHLKELINIWREIKWRKTENMYAQNAEMKNRKQTRYIPREVSLPSTLMCKIKNFLHLAAQSAALQSYTKRTPRKLAT